MISIQVANAFIAIVQTYMIFNFICKLWPSKHNWIKGNIITICMILVAYCNSCYLMLRIPPILRFWLGIAQVSLYIVLMAEGTLLQNIKRGFLASFINLLLEAILTFSVHSLIPINQRLILLDNNLVLFRILFSLVFYLYVSIVEIIMYWNKNRNLKIIAITSAFFSVCEMVLLIVWIYIITGKETPHLIVMSAFYSILLMLSYYIMTEMLYEILRQQKKKYELEQTFLEQKYQYNYYILAKEQAEQARDLRHDMRNQLQTIQYLMENETDKEKKHAEKMLKKLEKKVEKLNLEPLSYKK